jgi:hypothetical protein
MQRIEKGLQTDLLCGATLFLLGLLLIAGSYIMQ